MKAYYPLIFLAMLCGFLVFCFVVVKHERKLEKQSEPKTMMELLQSEILFNLTGWFGPEFQPFYEGEYEVRYSPNGYVFRAFWREGRWFSSYNTAFDLEQDLYFRGVVPPSTWSDALKAMR